jgi:hypothetical protein
MPVVFRCFYCRGKLSIARRKAGQDVECPRCQAIITVPAPDDLGDELTQLLTTSKEHAVVGSANASSSLAMANDEFEAAAAAAMDGLSLPMPAPPPTRKPPAKSFRNSSEMPLFEAEGIEQLLASKLGPEPLPLPTPKPVPQASSDFPSLVTEDAFVISRAKATLLMIGGVLAVGLAFAAGFVVRGW